MYQKVLVPLDGSELAECVLPHVETIASGCGVASAVFLRVVEPAYFPVGTVSEGGGVFTEVDAARTRKDMDLRAKQDAKEYLDGLVRRLQYSTTKVKTAVVMGKAAATIADYATKNQVDLIVIATHGRSGVSRWVWGSVADRVLRSACIPVLMVRPPGCEAGV